MEMQICGTDTERPCCSGFSCVGNGTSLNGNIGLLTPLTQLLSGIVGPMSKYNISVSSIVFDETGYRGYEIQLSCIVACLTSSR